jgi:hypothetical protein
LVLFFSQLSLLLVFFDISDSNAPAPNPNAAAARFAAMEQRMKERNSELILYLSTRFTRAIVIFTLAHRPQGTNVVCSDQVQ